MVENGLAEHSGRTDSLVEAREFRPEQSAALGHVGQISPEGKDLAVRIVRRLIGYKVIQRSGVSIHHRYSHTTPCRYFLRNVTVVPTDIDNKIAGVGCGVNKRNR